MPEFHRSKVLNFAYQLDENSFHEIEKVMNQLNDSTDKKSIVYSARLKDRTTILNLSLHELLELSNIKDSKITSITVATDIFEKNSLSITFKSWEKEPIEYSLHTQDEKDLMYYQQKTDQILESFKAMYSPLSVSNWIVSFLLILVGTMVMTSFGQTLSKLDSLSAIMDLYAILFILGILTGFLGGLSQLKIFPVAEFKIGHGKVRAERLTWMRNAVILSLFLGFVGTIVGSIL